MEEENRNKQCELEVNKLIVTLVDISGKSFTKKHIENIINLMED